MQADQRCPENGSQGLGFSPRPDIPGPSPFINILGNNQTDNLIFSIWLNPDTSKVNAGLLSLGGSNATRYTGELVYMPVVSTS